MNAIEYFKSLGFTNLLYRDGTSGSVCYSNLENSITVTIDPDESKLMLNVMDRMVVCSIGPFSYPNRHIPEFINQLEGHANLANEKLVSLDLDSDHTSSHLSP
jgi:hypothetical protein